MSGAGLAEDTGRAEATFFQLWATHEMPVSLTDDAMDGQRDGSMTTILGTGGGSVLRIGILGPGTRSPMHRTESLDYGICLEGECDMELDGGEVVTVRAGDVVIQRGTNHVWHNRFDRGLPLCLDPARRRRPSRSMGSGSVPAGATNPHQERRHENHRSVTHDRDAPR